MTISFVIIAAGYVMMEWLDARPVQIHIDEAALAQTLIEKPEKDAYDLVVIGGEPEGVAAAVSAARNGVRTLLIEHRDGLGGLYTYGWLNYLDIPRGHDGKTLARGIFAEWHNLVGERDGFSVEQAKQSFLHLVVNEPNLSLMLEAKLTDVRMNKAGNFIKEVQVTNDKGTYRVQADRYIDATQDADLAAIAGVPYFVGQADLGYEKRLMAVTPIIKVQGINWRKLKRSARDNILGGAEFNGHVAWGFVQLHERYEPKQDEIRLRGLNIVRVKNKPTEDYYINALHLFGVDVLDEASKQEALNKGIEEFEHILSYLQKELPGFEEAYISERPTEMYIRESRHILAEYQLQASDLWRNQDHWDSIGYGGYPADIQATSMDDMGIVAGNPDRYAIPYRSLVPLQVDNLLVVGRAAGYSSLAAGSARVVPTGMVTGEAAGVAAAISLSHQIDFRELSKARERVEQLREQLAEQGAWVDHYELDYRYKGEFFEDALIYLMDHSIMATDYNNEMYVDEDFNVKFFANVMLNGIRQSPNPAPPGDQQALASLYGLPADQMVQKRDDFAQLMLAIFDNKQIQAEAAWDAARQAGFIDELIYDRIDENRALTRGEGFYIMAHLLEHVVNKLP